MASTAKFHLRWIPSKQSRPLYASIRGGQVRWTKHDKDATKLTETAVRRWLKTIKGAYLEMVNVDEA